MRAIARIKQTLGLAAVFALIGAATASAEIELVEGLTVDGFVDMSATVTDPDTGESTETMSMDQFEIGFSFTPEGPVSARVEIDHQPDDVADDMEVEQAYFTYDAGNGLELKAGRFLTPHGYEGAEPIFLWQYSVSATIIGYAGYGNGVAARYHLPDELGSIYVSAVDGSYSGDRDADDVSFEAQIKLTPIEGLTLQAAYASEEFAATPAAGDPAGPDFAPGIASYDQGIANFWAEYAVGDLTLAAEYNSLFEIGGPNGDGDGYLVMANYAFGKAGLTLRHSGVDLDTGFENTEFTISPSYAITDNLLALVEYRHDDIDFADGSTGDSDTFAGELIFTF